MINSRSSWFPTADYRVRYTGDSGQATRPIERWQDAGDPAANARILPSTLPPGWILGMFETGLAAARSLGRAGIRIHGIDFDPGMAGSRSRYVRFHRMPSPVTQPDELVETLLHAARQEPSPGILFPATDAYALFMSRYRSDLSSHFRFAISSPEVLEAMVNKRRQYELAEKVDTPYARTYYPESIDDVHRIKQELDYPAFIKPYYGHLWRERFGESHKGFKVHGPEELTDRFKVILPTGLQAMVQSIILGPNTNHFKVNVYMDATGEPLAVFTLRKIRQYPIEFGVGTLVESLRYPELVELGLEFFRGIGYRGIGSIEFKLDERDGKLKMIELNPRLWWQNALAETCGINFPLIAYRDLVGLPVSPQTTFVEGVKWLDPVADTASAWTAYRQGSLSPLSWLTSLRGVRYCTWFSRDDPFPGLHDTQYGLKLLRLAASYLLRNLRRS